jgi:hypothetical protein
MGVYALTYQDFQRIFRACRGLLLNESVPGTELRDFLLLRLRGNSRDTAAKISRFDAQQMGVLAHEIVEFHEFHSLVN